MGTARFSFTQDDMIAAQRAWWMGAASWHAFLKTLIGLTAVYALIALAITWDAPWRGRIEAMWFALLVAFVVTACLFAIGCALSPRRARRAFREHKAIAGEFDCEWDAHGIIIRHDSGTTTLPWAKLHAWAIGPKTVMLYQTSNLFNAIPRRAIGTTDVGQIADQLRRAGVPERKRFGLLSWRPDAPADGVAS